MSDVRILIVEDDSIIAEEMEVALKGSGYRVTAITDNCEATLESVKNDPPDLIFMDIRISGEEDGIETALRLKDLGDFPVIFLTNLHDKPTLQRAMQVNPANYLAKPFTSQQLFVSIQHALLNFSKNQPASVLPANGPADDIIPLKDIIFIRDKNGSFTKQRIDDILYIEADRAYCTIYTDREKFVQSTSMGHIKDKMNHPHLVQVGRSHVVNVNKIDRLKGNVIVIADNEIKVGKHFREDLYKHLNLVR